MSTGTTAGGLTIGLHGLTLRLESRVTAFLDYVATAMQPFIVEPTPQPDILSRLEWVNEAPSSSLQATFGVTDWQARPDRDLYLAGDTAYWLRIEDFAPLKLAISRRRDGLALTGRYYFHLGRTQRLEWLRWLRHRGRLERLQRKRFSTLLYYLVYHPLLWMLERREGWHPLHAASVTYGDGAIVLTGFPGCGKSTLAVSMLSDPAVSMLSDNLVLYNRKHVLACPELLLLDASSLERIGSARSRLQGTGEMRVFERDAFRPDRYELGPRRPRAFFHVGAAKETRVEPMSGAQALARILAGNTMAKEVRRVQIMSEVVDLVAGATAPDAREALRELLADVPVFALWVGRDADLPALAAEAITGSGLGVQEVASQP